MPVVHTSDDMFMRAEEAKKEQIALLASDDYTQEEFDRLEKTKNDYYNRSELMKKLEAEKQDAIDQYRPGSKPDDNLDKEKGNDKPDPFNGFKSIGEWFSSIYSFHKRRIADPRLKYWGGGDNHRAIRVTDEKALAENVGASGGFLVQPEFERRIRAVQATMAIMRPRATIIRMNARTMTINVLDQSGAVAGQFSWYGGIVTYWTEEAGQMSETQPAFRQETLTAHNLTAYTISSTQLLDDSGGALEDFLMGNLGFPGAIAATEDYAFLQGDGVGKPEGIIRANARYLVNRTTANTVTYDDLAKMLTHMLPQGNAIWVAHQSVLEKLLLMNGPSGNPVYLWGSPAAGVPNTLLGRPIIFTDKLPYVGTEGDIIYIDPQYYLIGDRQQTTIDLSTEELFRTNQVSWRANHRVDGKPWLNSTITYADGTFVVSPFVILSDMAT